jgi:hypothetical protein
MTIYTYVKTRAELSIKPERHPAKTFRCSYPAALASMILFDATKREDWLQEFRVIIHTRLKGRERLTITTDEIEYLLAQWRERARAASEEFQGVEAAPI